MLLIENPRAGRRKAKGYLDGVVRALRGREMDLTLVTTQRPGEAFEIARRDGAAYDVVACAGGDGTLHEVVSGLLEQPGRPAVGYIPTGTSNDFAYSLRLDKSPERAGLTVLDGHPQPLDVGDMNGQPFIYLASFGTLSEVAYDTPQAQKNRWGMAVYIARGAWRLKDVRGYRATITHDGGTETGDFAFCSVSNARRIGGGLIRFDEGQVVMDDGLFEMVLVRKPEGFWRMVRVLLGLIAKRMDPRYVLMVKTAAVRVEAGEAVPWCVDGEDGGKFQRVEIALRPKRISMMTGV